MDWGQFLGRERDQLESFSSVKKENEKCKCNIFDVKAVFPVAFHICFYVNVITCDVSVSADEDLIFNMKTTVPVSIFTI